MMPPRARQGMRMDGRSAVVTRVVSRSPVRLLTLVAALAAGACGGLRHLEHESPQVARTFPLTASLRGQPIELHLAAPAQPHAPDVLVLYASGDGGWFGAAVDMFRAIANAGFYTVGVSSRTLLHREAANGEPPTVAELADDFETMLTEASVALNLPPDRRVVLAGWSRGASLAVLVGGVRRPPRNLSGVIAIGLAADENLKVRRESDDDQAERGILREESDLDMYKLIDSLAPHRCAVIQSTGDGYLPAARARQLFGADSDIKRFFAVRASNHRFAGGVETFAASLREALGWVTSADQDGAGE